MFNDLNVQVNIQIIQNMKCIFYHFNQTSFGNNQTLSKKTIVSYNPLHGIISMKKHIENEPPSTITDYKQKLKIVDESGQCVR